MSVRQAYRSPHHQNITRQLLTTMYPPINAQLSSNKCNINLAIPAIKSGQITSMQRAVTTYNVLKSILINAPE